MRRICIESSLLLYTKIISCEFKMFLENTDFIKIVFFYETPFSVLFINSLKYSQPNESPVSRNA